MKRRILVLALAVCLVFSLGMSSVAMAAAEEILPVETPLQDELLTEEVSSVAQSAVSDELTEQSATETADAKIMAGNYNATDVAALQAFLAQISKKTGKTNAEILMWNIKDPSTWCPINGISWNEASWDENGRLTALYFSPNENMGGSLDVSKCSAIREIGSNAGGLDSLDFTNCQNVKSVFMNAVEIHGTVLGSTVNYSAENGTIMMDYSMRNNGTFASVDLYASPKENYVFDGWYDENGNIVSKEVPLEFIDKSTIAVKYPTLTAKFVPKQVFVNNISLQPAKSTIGKGKSLALIASVAPSNAANRAVTWKSSNTKVATVSSSGVVKGIGNGKATITATAKDGSGIRANCAITVSSSLKPVTGIKLSKTAIKLNVNKTATLSVTISPSNATNKALIWTSSNTKAVKVAQNGKITALSKGSATITATATDGSGKKVTCKVTVV